MDGELEHVRIDRARRWEKGVLVVRAIAEWADRVRRKEKEWS